MVFGNQTVKRVRSRPLRMWRSVDRGNKVVVHVPHKCTLVGLHIVVLHSIQRLKKIVFNIYKLGGFI